MELKVGDILKIKAGGYGFCSEDIGKEVRVVGTGTYFDEPAIKVEPLPNFEYETPFHWYSESGGYIYVGWKSFNLEPSEVTFVESKEESEYTGGSSNYYKVFVKNPTTLADPYEAECNDIIEALEMTFAEGNAFKAIWRKAKARQGVKKKGYDSGVYDSEKVIFFGERMLVEAKERAATSS